MVESSKAEFDILHFKTHRGQRVDYKGTTEQTVNDVQTKYQALTERIYKNRKMTERIAAGG